MSICDRPGMLLGAGHMSMSKTWQSSLPTGPFLLAPRGDTQTVWSRGRDTILEAVVRGRDFWTERKVSPRTCQENNKCKGLRQEGSFQEQECGPWSWSKARENRYIFLNPHVPKLPNCNWAEESWDTGHGSWNGEWEGFYFHLPLTHFSCTCNRILKGTQPAFQPKTPRDVRAQVRKHQRVTTQQARG